MQDDRRFVSDRDRLALTLGPRLDFTGQARNSRPVPRTTADDLAGRFDGEDDGEG